MICVYAPQMRGLAWHLLYLWPPASRLEHRCETAYYMPHFFCDIDLPCNLWQAILPIVQNLPLHLLLNGLDEAGDDDDEDGT